MDERELEARKALYERNVEKCKQDEERYIEDIIRVCKKYQMKDYDIAYITSIVGLYGFTLCSEQDNDLKLIDVNHQLTKICDE